MKLKTILTSTIITAFTATLPVSAALSGEELQAVQDEMFVYIMNVENAAAKGPIEENPILSFTYEQLGLFLEGYNGNTFIDNSSQKYQLYTAFTSWQVTDSGYKNFYPITVYGETCFTDNVETYTFVDTGDAYVMTSSDGTQVGTYEKLYQFAYLNAETTTTTYRTQPAITTQATYQNECASATTAAPRGQQQTINFTTAFQTQAYADTSSEGVVTTAPEVIEAMEESKGLSTGVYATIAGGIVIVGGGVTAAVWANRKKHK